ncbi:STAS domain-containing protein [Blastococcus sp. CT_GayMR19]|uniref:STAS domain-containing protein n=1 Tax=Blastococcus sp. CT_GayMR19 TaxID=2559608 RepID=UPI0014310640|nr:STAS domain-containing protein [Blastococcus sp. CT_GayMR19]
MHTYPEQRPPAGSITIEHEGADRRVLCLRGDVDTEVAARFTSSQGRERVAVDAIDAGAVTFISSSGLALLLLCVEASRAAGRHPLLRAASRSVDRALRMAGIDSVFPRPEPDEGPAPHAGSAAGNGDAATTPSQASAPGARRPAPGAR